jgi:hypothetical protein
MAEDAVERRRVSIALACRAFGVSETCYRYSPKLRDENEAIADLLVGLTEARKMPVSSSCGVAQVTPKVCNGRIVSPRYRARSSSLLD